jgi:hypothetical protein
LRNFFRWKNTSRYSMGIMLTLLIIAIRTRRRRKAWQRWWNSCLIQR